MHWTEHGEKQTARLKTQMSSFVHFSGFGGNQSGNQSRMEFSGWKKRTFKTAPWIGFPLAWWEDECQSYQSCVSRAEFHSTSADLKASSHTHELNLPRDYCFIRFTIPTDVRSDEHLSARVSKHNGWLCGPNTLNKPLAVKLFHVIYPQETAEFNKLERLNS